MDVVLAMSMAIAFGLLLTRWFPRPLLPIDEHQELSTQSFGWRQPFASPLPALRPLRATNSRMCPAGSSPTGAT
jgi:hypothetical protein